MTGVLASAGARHFPAGPVLGIRLPSDAWTAACTVTSHAALEAYETEVQADGPIFLRVRTEYRFAGAESYVLEVTLRAEDPFVRLDERYEKAGSVAFDLGAGLMPARFATKADFRGTMQLTPIPYEKENKLPSFVGWDIYLPILPMHKVSP